jgi:hypothetical protein
MKDSISILYKFIDLNILIFIFFNLYIF